MAKVYTQFQTKTAQKHYSLGLHIPLWLYKRVSPPPPPGFGQIVVQIFSVRVKELKLSKTNLVVSMHIKRGKASLTVDVRRSKTVLLCTATSVKFQSTFG